MQCDGMEWNGMELCPQVCYSTSSVEPQWNVSLSKSIVVLPLCRERSALRTDFYRQSWEVKLDSRYNCDISINNSVARAAAPEAIISCGQVY